MPLGSCFHFSIKKKLVPRIEKISYSIGILANNPRVGVRCLTEEYGVLTVGVACSVVTPTCHSDGPARVIACLLQSSGHNEDSHRVDLQITEEENTAELDCTCSARQDQAHHRRSA
ncbi:hypothetical protein MRX96_008995 [Rhipicephalus microplus]